MKALKRVWRAVRTVAAYLQREPGQTTAVVATAYAVARGVQTGHVTVDAIVALVMAVAALVSRGQTTPLSRPQDADSAPLRRTDGSAPLKLKR